MLVQNRAVWMPALNDGRRAAGESRLIYDVVQSIQATAQVLHPKAKQTSPATTSQGPGQGITGFRVPPGSGQRLADNSSQPGHGGPRFAAGAD